MCSLTIECVLRLQNVFSYCRMCSLSREELLCIAATVSMCLFVFEKAETDHRVQQMNTRPRVGIYAYTLALHIRVYSRSKRTMPIYGLLIYACHTWAHTFSLHTPTGFYNLILYAYIQTLTELCLCMGSDLLAAQSHGLLQP